LASRYCQDIVNLAETSYPFSGIMVKGKPQLAKSQANRRNPVGTSKQAAASSPAQTTNKAKAVKQSLMSCNGCGVVITDDVKALQCDRCQSTEPWKCADCLNIPADMYDHLLADPNCSLRWFCSKCDKAAMDLDNSSSNRIDTLVDLVEKLLEKLSSVDSQIKEKCDIDTVNHLEARVKVLEDCMEQQGKEQVNKLATLEQTIMNHLAEETCRPAVVDQNVNVGAGEMHQNVVDEVARRIERDNDIQTRKNNIVIYKVAEVDAEDPADRNASDWAFVTELLDNVFKINPLRHGITRILRLGRMDDTRNAPRPLLVVFSEQKFKEQVMSSLKYLKDADAPYKGISVAHDLSPWQREEIKRLVEQAKHEHVNASSEPVENYWFRVVGSGARMRVMKVKKKEKPVQLQPQVSSG